MERISNEKEVDISYLALTRHQCYVKENIVEYRTHYSDWEVELNVLKLVYFIIKIYECM